ncbi:MAG: hypothetical protein AB1510_12565, partial [Bacillota bacterium]
QRSSGYAFEKSVPIIAFTNHFPGQALRLTAIHIIRNEHLCRGLSKNTATTRSGIQEELCRTSGTGFYNPTQQNRKNRL